MTGISEAGRLTSLDNPDEKDDQTRNRINKKRERETNQFKNAMEKVLRKTTVAQETRTWTTANCLNRII